MHHHTSYRGRSHTKKQNSYKPKISAAEREKRLSQKKLAKLFSSWKTLHPFCTKNTAKQNSASTGAGFGVKSKSIYQHTLTVAKKSSVTNVEYRRMLA